MFSFSGDIDSQWNRVLDLMRSQLQTNTTVITMWGQYNDCASTVQHTLDNIHPVTEEALVFNTQPEVKQCLDRTKVGFVEWRVSTLVDVGLGCLGMTIFRCNDNRTTHLQNEKLFFTAKIFRFNFLKDLYLFIKYQFNILEAVVIVLKIQSIAPIKTEHRTNSLNYFVRSPLDLRISVSCKN